jgi:ribosomal protein S18 acetylase RimI-like enzyme
MTVGIRGGELPTGLTIERIAPQHIEGFHRTLDCVARERKHLAFLEAPPLDSTRKFVMDNIAKGYPQFVAVADATVVGWCDVIPMAREVYAHRGVLGMGLLPSYRGRGCGAALINTTLAEAQRQGFARIELTVYADNAAAIALYRRAGFKTEAILKRGARMDGLYKDLIVMAIVHEGIAPRNRSRSRSL